nr:MULTISPECIES: relaxase/mobilization nuclease domain-containing protein [unclassified Rhodococcus (in: high G+C Gram-positive bacteria)]
MTGLVVYLAGPGRSNEHENPHIVAGHETIMFTAPTGELNHEDAIELAGKLDTARVVFGKEVTVTSKRKMNAAIDDGVPRSVALADATSDQNVWHCSLSLNPDEGELSDEKWAAIASDFMKEMGFDDPDSPRAPARWVAIRHGKTKAGGDHIHIAASAVREDGTKVNTFNDFKRSQQACNVLEHRHQLVVLSSRESERGSRGIKPAEAARARRAHAPETAREVMERTVRACATASKTEAEFVRRLRARKLLVRPRYEKGTAGEVVGYSVATTPTPAERANGGRPVWYGGGRLSKDLTLPRLRDEWDQGEDARTAAAAEWKATRRGTAVTVSNGRERAPIAPTLIARAAQDIAKWNTYLASIPTTDTAQWARAAGRTSGVFAAWSARMEPTPGPLAAAARTLADSAQIAAHQRAAVAPKRLSAGGAALILLQVGTTDPAAGHMLLLHQLTKTVQAIADAHRAAGDLTRASRVETLARTELATMRAQLQPAPDAQALSSSPVTVAERTRPLTASEQRRAYNAEVDARTDIAEDIKDVLKARYVDTVGLSKPVGVTRQTVSPRAAPNRGPDRVGGNEVER